MRKALEISSIIILAATGVVLGLRAASGGRTIPDGAALLSFGATQPTGTGYKTLTVMPGGLMSPLYITRVTVGNRAMVLGAPMSAREQRSNPNLIHNGRPFQAGDDWLSTARVYIRNRTGKTVDWIDLSILFPEAGNGRTEPAWIYHIQLGRLPAVDAFGGRTGKPLFIPPNAKALNLGPDQEISVDLANYIDKLKAYVENVMPFMMVTKCVVETDDCAFTDGMRFAAGAYSVPDTSHHGKWKYLPSSYFPGNPRRSWPPGL